MAYQTVVAAFDTAAHAQAAAEALKADGFHGAGQGTSSLKDR